MRTEIARKIIEGKIENKTQLVRESRAEIEKHTKLNTVEKWVKEKLEGNQIEDFGRIPFRCSWTTFNAKCTNLIRIAKSGKKLLISSHKNHHSQIREF